MRTGRKENHVLKIDRHAKTFSTLETPKLAEAALTERYDLQEYICKSPAVFFRELGQPLHMSSPRLILRLPRIEAFSVLSTQPPITFHAICPPQSLFP
jgi:hypothetical protein